MRTYNRTPADAARARPIKLRILAAPVQIDAAAWVRARDIHNARFQLDNAAEAYAIACKKLGEANRRLGKSKLNNYFSMTQRLGWRADAFRAINVARSRMAQARKQLAALGAL